MAIAFRADVIIDKKLIIDFKAIEKVPPIHFRRVRSYLIITKIKLALVINFDVMVLKDGIKRIENGLKENWINSTS